MKFKLLFAIGIVSGSTAIAQASPQTTLVETSKPGTYRVVVVSRTVQAINYRHRGEATDVDFAGTALLPSAGGKAKVRTKRSSQTCRGLLRLGVNTLPTLCGPSLPKAGQ